MQKLNEGLAIINQILLALMHFNEFVLYLLELFLRRLQLLGLLLEQLNERLTIQALILRRIRRCCLIRVSH